MAKGTSLVRLEADTGSYERNMRQAQKTFDDFLRGIGVSVPKIGAMTAAIGAAAAAIKVAKDAFKSNEVAMDDWKSAIAAAEGVYNGFLYALNTGDVSGYLSNIDRIVQAAQTAYDALDELGTHNAFNQVNLARARREMTESIADFREGTGSKEGVKAAADAYKQELDQRRKLEEEAYKAQVASIAAQRGVSSDDLMKALSGTYGDYKELKSIPLSGVRQRALGGSITGVSQVVKEAYATNEAERLGQALRLFEDPELGALQALKKQAEDTGDQIAQVDRQVARLLGRAAGGTGGGSSRLVSGGLRLGESWGGIGIGTTESMRDLQAQRSLYQSRLATATDFFSAADAQAGLEKVQKLIDAQPLALRLGISAEEMVKIQDQMADLKKDIKPIDITGGSGGVKTAKDTASAWSSAAQAVANVGSALQGLDDPSAKIAGIVGQAVANIALGFAQAAASPATGAAGVFGWIAAATAGLATMVSTIASIKSATAGSYAQGGIVPGNSYSGDNMYGRLNAGELILSRSQQSSIASQLSDQRNRAVQSRPYVEGEKIYLGLTNYLRGSNRGELVTTR